MFVISERKGVYPLTSIRWVFFSGIACAIGPFCNPISTVAPGDCTNTANCSQFFSGWSGSSCLRFDGTGFCCDGAGRCSSQIGAEFSCVPAEACVEGTQVMHATCAPGCKNTTACQRNERITSQSTEVCLSMSPTQDGLCSPLPCDAVAHGVQSGECMRFTRPTWGFCNRTGQCSEDITQCIAAGAGTTGSGVRCASASCVRPGSCSIYQRMSEVTVGSLCFSDYLQSCDGAGNVCGAGGSCGPKLFNGQTCVVGVQCQSGNCVDGVCCNDICTSPCKTCGTGTCTAVADTLEVRCPAVNCEDFVFGWVGALNSTCSAFAGTVGGFCFGGECDRSAGRCSSAVAAGPTCGSPECKRNCPTGASKLDYSSISGT
jgi:hypothetical protein